MKTIGVFICNYNGKDYVINCIKSLLEQKLQDFDIFVVDNASTDGTSDEVNMLFGDKVNVICNSSNLGGAGGFDRGLKCGLEKGYQYIALLDNDILLDNDAIGKLYEYLEANQDTGIVGAKVMVMDEPDTVQDFGNLIDFKLYKEKLCYCHMKDDFSVPEVHECDYVPSCAILIRSEMLRKSGTMPADNFIYYDDIELSYKMKLKHYKVAAYGAAKVWHKGGFRKATVDTFSKYYFLRNRLNFFAKYIPEDDIEKFSEDIVKDVFMQLYGFHNKGMKELFDTTMYAFDDFLHNVRWKADDYKIKKIVDRDTPFAAYIKEKNNILIRFIDNFSDDELDIYHILLFIVGKIIHTNKNINIAVTLENCNTGEEEFLIKLAKAMGNYMKNFPEITLVRDSFNYQCDVILQMCKHVNLVDKRIFPEIYVDKYCNCIIDENEYKYFTGYDTSFGLFKAMYKPLVLQGIRKIRE